MKKNFNISSTIGMASLLLSSILLPANEAHAYLDPQSGSMIAQAFLAGSAGLIVLLQMYAKTLAPKIVSTLRNFFRR